MAPELRRTLGFRDLVLFYIATTFSLRWIATAAAAGPSALVIWVFAALGLFVPLVFTVLELSSRYPDEGGMYVWSKRAFGPFAGFITGWTYWSANLPYFPGLLYFAAANILFAGGPSAQALSSNSTYFLIVSFIGLGVAVGLNIVGLNVGKWMTNISAVAGWGPVLLLIGFGFYSWMTYGSATPITAASLMPSTGFKDVIFWSTIAFAFGGVESASTMGDEIVDARRTVPRAILTAAALITIIYIVATLCVLLALPKEQVSGLQGFMQAIQAVAGKAGVSWLVPILALLVSLNAFGAVAGWFAATARLPFVAGIDRFLPRAFADLHPRWQTPHVALLVQAGIAAVFVFLGQAGTSVLGAYEVLVSMSIIGNFIPFLFMFAAMIKLQDEPAGPGVMRVPGGSGVARVLGGMGFAVSAAAIVLACVPADEEPLKMLAVTKVVGASVALVAIGAMIYLVGKRRS
jgi:glutamate:GABA antiporter